MDETPSGFKVAIGIFAFIVTTILTVWWFLFLWAHVSLVLAIIITLFTFWIPGTVSYWIGMVVLAPLAMALGLIKRRKQ